MLVSRAAQAVLLSEEGIVVFPIGALVAGTICSFRGRDGLGMHGQRQVPVNKTDLVRISRHQLLIDLLVPDLAIGTLVIAELNDGNRSVTRPDGRLVICRNGHAPVGGGGSGSRGFGTAPKQVAATQPEQKRDRYEHINERGYAVMDGTVGGVEHGGIILLLTRIRESDRFKRSTGTASWKNSGIG